MAEGMAKPSNQVSNSARISGESTADHGTAMKLLDNKALCLSRCKAS